MIRAALGLPRDAQIITSVSKIIAAFRRLAALSWSAGQNYAEVDAGCEDRKPDRLVPRDHSTSQRVVDPRFCLRTLSKSPIAKGASAWPFLCLDREP
jgi:hypothetical protein